MHGAVLESPLYYAAAAGDDETVKTLIGMGAHLDSQTIVGYTPVHIAVINKKSSALATLAISGANLSLPDRLGNTPLHYSCEQANLEVTQLLISFGADVKAENDEDRVPLEITTPRGPVCLLSAMCISFFTPSATSLPVTPRG